MAKRIAITNLQGTTLDIINTIRANASSEYQSLVPKVDDLHDVRKVGEVLYGYPALANQFISALVNRIAMVKIKSATFNNAYAELKKGYLEFGETVEEAFVEIAKAREFNVEKAEERELKRTIPDVRAAFHTMNYRAQYAITIQQEDLRMAFLSIDGVTDLIAKITSSVLVGAEYDEFLLFKYLLIKAIANGKVYAKGVDTSDIKNCAKAFRGMSNALQFMKTQYNNAGVHTTTSKDDQYIFMDTQFNADYDVDVLASAFNMDKATFSGHLKLIDDFTSFDNERFSVIYANSDNMEPVTEDELALMQGVKAVILDKEWFQIYDNLTQMTEKQVASGLYWNYFYNVWKTVSSSPFSNAVVFVDNSSVATLPATLTATIDNITKTSAGSVVYTLSIPDTTQFSANNPSWVQTEDCVENGVAVHKYGVIIVPSATTTYTLDMAVELGGETYTASDVTIAPSTTVGTTITLSK